MIRSNYNKTKVSQRIWVLNFVMIGYHNLFSSSLMLKKKIKDDFNP